MRRIFYNSLAIAPAYALIRAELSEEFALVTLDEDSNAQRRMRIVDCELAIVAATPLTAPVIEAARALKLVHNKGSASSTIASTLGDRER